MIVRVKSVIFKWNILSNRKVAFTDPRWLLFYGKQQSYTDRPYLRLSDSTSRECGA